MLLRDIKLTSSSQQCDAKTYTHKHSIGLVYLPTWMVRFFMIN